MPEAAPHSFFARHSSHGSASENAEVAELVDDGQSRLAMAASARRGDLPADAWRNHRRLSVHEHRHLRAWRRGSNADGHDAYEALALAHDDMAGALKAMPTSRSRTSPACSQEPTTGTRRVACSAAVSKVMPTPQRAASARSGARG
jgi:hypothetical protein